MLSKICCFIVFIFHKFYNKNKLFFQVIQNTCSFSQAKKFSAQKIKRNAKRLGPFAFSW